jgi:hypothetical protein
MPCVVAGWLSFKVRHKLHVSSPFLGRRLKSENHHCHLDPVAVESLTCNLRYLPSLEKDVSGVKTDDFWRLILVAGSPSNRGFPVIFSCTSLVMRVARSVQLPAAVVLRLETPNAARSHICFLQQPSSMAFRYTCFSPQYLIRGVNALMGNLLNLLVAKSQQLSGGAVPWLREKVEKRINSLILISLKKSNQTRASFVFKHGW